MRIKTILNILIIVIVLCFFSLAILSHNPQHSGLLIIIGFLIGFVLMYLNKV